MNIDKYNKFLGSNDYRQWLHNPFINQGRSVFLNGHVMLVSPIVDGVEHGACCKSSLDIVSGLVSDLISADFLPVDVKNVPKKCECYKCGGSRVITRKACPECDNDPYYEIESSYGTSYDVVCQTCEDSNIYGYGNYTCEVCKGSGVAYPNGANVIIGGVAVNPTYYDYAIDLGDDVEFCDLGDDKAGFRCGDVVGLIKGLRR